jgi:Fe-S oxidoreductase
LPVEVVLILIIISGFLVEGLRISANGPEPGSVIGNWIALTFLGNLGNDLFIHTYIWWIHGLLALGLIAYIPFSPLVHLVLAPVNSGLANPLPGPKMGVLDFSTFEEDVDTESEPNLGVACLSDFSWKRLLDFETCLWCGRCHEVCPATQTDKPLSPKKVLVSLADNLNKGLVEDELINKSISSDAVYNCTTCAACLEVCPVSINQPKAIMRLRQNLIMEQSIIPDTMGQAHKSLESRQHPFFGTSAGPHDWHKELNVPFFEKGVTEYLLWVGCAPTYEDRAQNIAKAMVEILSKAGISYGILEESRCTGDPGKQMGNEFLFNEIAQQNVEELNSLGVKKIITLCPHCYNSFTRHYPQLGGHYEVIPHSILLAKLIHEGRLNIQNTGKTICYHDPCYLGRRNEIYNEPRTVISKLGKLVEMPRNKANSFCCGGGGGNYWAEEEGTRINRNRAKEGLNTKADLIATACPFCLLMLTDGLKGFTEEQKVFDLAEIIINDLNK